MKKFFKTVLAAVIFAALFAVPVLADVTPPPAQPRLDYPRENHEVHEAHEAYEQDDSYESYDHGHSNPAAHPAQANFLSVTGKVAKIERHEGQYSMYIRIEGPAGDAVLHATPATLVLGQGLRIGDKITAYYAAGPMVLSYPPRYEPVLIVNGEFKSVKIDSFAADGNGGLVSEGGLPLKYDKNTPIFLQDGRDFRQYATEKQKDYAAALNGRTLVVVHSADEDLKIIVLCEKTPEYKLKKIEGTYFVPFRAVVNALGYGDTIVWKGETRTVTVYNGHKRIVFNIGNTEYYVGGETKTLSPAPVLIEDRTYVPYKFFQDIFGNINFMNHRS